jgi:hypothetical protein
VSRRISILLSTKWEGSCNNNELTIEDLLNGEREVSQIHFWGE